MGLKIDWCPGSMLKITGKRRKYGLGRFFCVNRPFVWFLLCGAVSGTLRGLLCWLKKFKYVKNKISENFQKFFNFYEIFIMRNVQIYFMNKIKNMQKSQNTENAKNGGFWAKKLQNSPYSDRKKSQKVADFCGFYGVFDVKNHIIPCWDG